MDAVSAVTKIILRLPDLLGGFTELIYEELIYEVMVY